MYISEISFILKDLILPLVTLLVTIFAMFIAYKKELFSPQVGTTSKSDQSETPKIIGDHNTIHFTPSEIQRQLAYDVDRFDEYHQQSISQSKISFWFSLVFASVGFLIIATSVFAYDDKSGYIGIVAGTIIDTVSALFFYQSNKARQLMSEFFDRLRSDRKLEESLKLCESIDNEILRNSLKVRLSLYFAGLDNSDGIATEIIRMVGKEKDKKTSSNPNVQPENET